MISIEQLAVADETSLTSNVWEILRHLPLTCIAILKPLFHLSSAIDGCWLLMAVEATFVGPLKGTLKFVELLLVAALFS